MDGPDSQSAQTSNDDGTNQDYSEKAHKSDYQSGTKSHKRQWWLPALITLAIIVLGASGWYLMNSKQTISNNTVPEQQTTSSTDQQATQTLDYPVADKLVYAHGDAYNKLGTLYYRPAAGGDRQVIMNSSQLSDFSYTSGLQVGPKIVFVRNSTEIWVVSNKTGAPLTKSDDVRIYKAPGDFTIGSAAMSKDGQKVAFALVPPLDKLQSNTTNIDLYLVDSDGKNVNKVGSSQFDGVFWFEPNYWLSGNYVVLSPGSPGTDAPPPVPQILNVDNGKLTEVSIDTGGSGYAMAATPAVSADGKQVVYALSTIDKSTPVEGLLGYYIGLPYKVYVKNLSSGETRQIATVGKRPADNSLTNQTISVGWLTQSGGQQRAYYTDSSTLYVEKSQHNGVDKYYESGQGNIASVLFATSDELIIGTQTPDYGQVITYFDVNKNKATKVMETTSNSQMYGVLIK